LTDNSQSFHLADASRVWFRSHFVSGKSTFAFARLAMIRRLMMTGLADTSAQIDRDT
jgi:hypothetical protein